MPKMECHQHLMILFVVVFSFNQNKRAPSMMTKQKLVRIVFYWANEPNETILTFIDWVKLTPSNRTQSTQVFKSLFFSLFSSYNIVEKHASSHAKIECGATHILNQMLNKRLSTVIVMLETIGKRVITDAIRFAIEVIRTEPC